MNPESDSHHSELKNSRGKFFSSLLKKSTGTIYKSLFDYISSVAKELKENQSFYTIDLAEVLWRVELWKKKMPNILPFFAVKTNSDPILLRLLVLLGFSFDCATEGEINYVLEAGGHPRNIIFAHVIKTPRALKYAASVGVDLLTFDSKQELLKIHKYHPTARLLLRIVPKEVECTFDLSEKFGCEIEEVKEILSFAQTLGLDIVGTSFHVGGLCRKAVSYAATIRAARTAFDTARQLGFHFKILDIGGGFLGDKSSEGFFHKISGEIQLALKDNFPEPEIEIIAEPGTYFACSAVTLATAIYGKKKRESNTINGGNPIRRFYYVNDSIYGSFFKGVEFYGCSLKPLLSDEELLHRPCYNSSVWGQTCCSEDVLMKERLLPELEEGEFLVWENMGAYNQVLCSTFCGVPLPAARCVFVNNSRLNLEWLKNLEELERFISETCSLVAEE